MELENPYSSDELKSQVGQLNKSLQQANSTITDLRSMIYPNAAEINHVKEMHECLKELADCVGNLSPGVSGCQVPNSLINKAIELVKKPQQKYT